MPGTGEPRAAQELLAFLVAHGVLCPRGGSDGLICVCLIGGVSVSVCRRGVGGGGNVSGCGDCGDGDGGGQSPVQIGMVIGSGIDLVRALWLILGVVVVEG